MEPKPEPMDNDRLGALCGAEIQSAIGNIGSTIADQRERAMQYYLGLPFGNELPDRSQVVLTEVRDVIEAQMPGLMKIFTSGDEIVRFEPEGPEDEAKAKQATEFINYILLRDNPGYEIIYNWVKDALMQKNGIVKHYWTEKKSVAEESYQGLDDASFAQLVADDTVTPIEHTQNPDGTHDLKVKRNNKVGRECIENIPPEEFLISRDATRIDNARFVGHRVVKTVSELRALGFAEDLIEKLPTEESVYWSTEATTRRYKDDELGSSQPTPMDPSMRRVTVVEGYYRVDKDGDGIAELRQIWTGSQGNPILSDEVWQGNSAPFASITPTLLPHRFFGLSDADMVGDIQLIKSTLARQLLDNIYQLNNQRMKVVMPTGDSVNLDDLLTNRPGGIVRVQNGGDVVPIPNIPVGDMVFPALEYMDSVKETRTGVSRNLQGLDGDELHKTAAGANQILTQTQERLLLVARNFAETGFKDLFRGILQDVCTHQSKPRVIKLNNQWVEMDPREWVNLYDMSIAVGLGTGNKQEQLIHLNTIMALQQAAFANGLTNLVGVQQLYNSAKAIVVNAGMKNPELYFLDPSQQPPAQPKPDPKAQELQAKMALEQQKAQMENQLAQQKMQMDAALQQHKAQTDAELARYKADQDAQVKIQVAGMEARLKAAVGMHSANLSGGMPA